MTKKTKETKEVTFKVIDGSDAVNSLAKLIGIDTETPQESTLSIELQNYYIEVCGLHFGTFKEFLKNLRLSDSLAFYESYESEIKTVIKILDQEWTGFDNMASADVSTVALIKTRELLIRVQQGLSDKKEALLTYLQNNEAYKGDAALITKIKQTNASKFYKFL